MGVAGGAVLDNDESHSVLPDGAGSASEAERYTERNQWLKASQYETTDSKSGGFGSGYIAHSCRFGGEGNSWDG